MSSARTAVDGPEHIGNTKSRGHRGRVPTGETVADADCRDKQRPHAASTQAFNRTLRLAAAILRNLHLAIIQHSLLDRRKVALGIDAGGVRLLVEIAEATSQREIVRLGGAAVLASDDVFDVEADETSGRLRQPAVFATLGGIVSAAGRVTMIGNFL